jgi:hypothetical protein
VIAAENLHALEQQRDELLAAAIAWNESRTTASEFALVEAIAKQEVV